MSTRSRRCAEAVKFGNRQTLIDSAGLVRASRLSAAGGGALARKVLPNGGYKRMRGRLKHYKIVRLSRQENGRRSLAVKSGGFNGGGRRLHRGIIPASCEVPQRPFLGGIRIGKSAEPGLGGESEQFADEHCLAHDISFG